MSAADAQTHHRCVRTSAEVEVEERLNQMGIGAKEEAIKTRGLLVGGVSVPGSGENFFFVNKINMFNVY